MEIKKRRGAQKTDWTVDLTRENFPAKSDADFHRQRRFVLEYAKDFNGTQACIRAGYSKNTANVIAHRLTKLPHIARMIKAAREDSLRRCELSVDKVISELMAVAFCDPAELFDDNGDMLPLKQIPKKFRTAIASIQQIGDGKKITLWNKVEALRNLGQHLRMFVDQVEVKDTTPLAERLAKARARVLAGMPTDEPTDQPEDPTVQAGEDATDLPAEPPEEHPGQGAETQESPEDQTSEPHPAPEP
jgi:phage terminase small subunit